jgi:hypothetical protein
MPIAKPLNAFATLGSAAHHIFERRAGVGVFLEPWLGRRNTNRFWAIVLPYGLLGAIRGGRRDEPTLAFNAGLATAGAIVHFTEWPWSLRFGVVPWLDEAEGLTPEQMPAYNVILLGWLLSGAGSILLETRRDHVRYALAGLACAPLLAASARHHFTWAAEQARLDPDRWSPSLVV